MRVCNGTSDQRLPKPKR